MLSTGQNSTLRTCSLFATVTLRSAMSHRHTCGPFRQVSPLYWIYRIQPTIVPCLTALVPVHPFTSHSHNCNVTQVIASSALPSPRATVPPKAWATSGEPECVSSLQYSLDCRSLCSLFMKPTTTLQRTATPPSRLSGV